MKRDWYCIDLEKDEAGFCRRMIVATGLDYESSGNGDLVHFEVFATIAEMSMLDGLLTIGLNG